MSKNEIKLFSNKELGFSARTMLNEDGSISVNAEDTAIGFGWTKTENKNGKEYTSIRWERMNGFSKEFGFAHEWGKDDYIPESLFYRLGMKASNKAADKFQNWLAMEVIPSIRKHGMYAVDELIANPELAIKAFTALKEEREKNKALQAENERMKPKEEFFDAVTDSKDAIDIGQVAKVLNFPEIGRNKLFEILRNNGILKQNNEPYQKYIDCGYFRVVEQKYEARPGEIRINIKTLVFQKGVDYIRKILDKVA